MILEKINPPARADATAQIEVSNAGIVTVGRERKQRTTDVVSIIKVSVVAVDIEY